MLCPCSYLRIMLSEKEYNELKSRLEKELKVKIKDKKIKALKINSAFHWQPPLYVEVDSWCAMLEKDTPPEKIVAIFEHQSYIVITPDRGYKPGTLPYFFVRPDIREVIEY